MIITLHVDTSVKACPRYGSECKKSTLCQSGPMWISFTQRPALGHCNSLIQSCKSAVVVKTQTFVLLWNLEQEINEQQRFSRVCLHVIFTLEFQFGQIFSVSAWTGARLLWLFSSSDMISDLKLWVWNERHLGKWLSKLFFYISFF